MPTCLLPCANPTLFAATSALLSSRASDAFSLGMSSTQEEPPMDFPAAAKEMVVQIKKKGTIEWYCGHQTGRCAYFCRPGPPMDLQRATA